MGLLGGLFLLSGIGAMLFGVVVAVASLWNGEWLGAPYGLGIVAGGLASGAVASAILE